VGTIEREIRQRRPFPSKAQEGAVALLRTADLLRRALAGVVDPRGITPQQYNVLRILRGAGAEGLPTLEIGARMIEQAPGVTRLLDRLEEKGLVRRARCPRDRRRVLCRIAPSGLRLLASLDQPMNEATESFLRPLGGEHTRRLIHLLDVVRTGDAGPSQPPLALNKERRP
jgi:DNA-binding MarR family transcriptional regulator